MDIYGAEIQVNKLLNFVKDLSDSKPRMYQKSKDRLKDLALTCNEVISVIATILQDESLVDNSNDEFGGSNVDEVNAVLNSMQDQIYELRQFINAPMYVDMDVDYHVVQSNEISKKESSNYLHEDRKLALKSYRKCLSELSDSSMQVLEAEDCSQLLWTWFSTRFIVNTSNFKYKMSMLPEWVRDIVIMYGYNHESNSIESFKSRFNSWLESINSDMNYAIPPDVYHPDSSMMTLTAVVIWDILLDHGLRNLCRDDSDLYPSEDCVYDMVGAVDGNIMDPYTNYAYDPSILTKCNLTLKVGDDK